MNSEYERGFKEGYAKCFQDGKGPVTISPYPYHHDFPPRYARANDCNCPLYHVCGNAACPRALRVTSVQTASGTVDVLSGFTTMKTEPGGSPA